MNFVDEIKLECVAGNGGNGVVRWHNSRNNPKGGPAGGDGGRGGDVRIRAVRDISRLGKYRGNTLFEAGHGEGGGKSSLHGADGKDVVIDLPIGSIVRLLKKSTDARLHKKDNEFELLTEGEEFVVLKGGVGGLGNEHFKGSKNVSPKESTEGRSGERDVLQIELRIIADLGLVGYPNAGKTSLLNALTNAKGKVGNYEFTTLDPNLGELFGYIIADIPGIIEGASEGRGLGHKFLRHISRTKTLIFCISVEQDDPKLAFTTLMDELVKFDYALQDVPFVIALTKTDLVDSDTVNAAKASLESISERVYPVSIYDEESLKSFADSSLSFLRSLQS